MDLKTEAFLNIWNEFLQSFLASFTILCILLCDVKMGSVTEPVKFAGAEAG